MQISNYNHFYNILKREAIINYNVKERNQSTIDSVREQYIKNLNLDENLLNDLNNTFIRDDYLPKKAYTIKEALKNLNSDYSEALKDLKYNINQMSNLIYNSAFSDFDETFVDDGTNLGNLKTKLNLKLRVIQEYKVSNIYQRAFSDFFNPEDKKELREFLKDFKINNEYIDESLNNINDSDILKLLCDKNISVKDFISECKRLKAIKENHTILDNKKDDFEAIEVKGTSTRENMEEILSKIDPRKVKDERDLLAIVMAYKDSKNLYDKRI
ncbi:hypothetical protein [Campylobacter sp. 2018MI10]|uniref:hypothetical protein n=1 Tax=Campylobacter sp. 2018MI10 TaxID=2836736 RepID=UPI001BD93A12|nr:hypothetical protein [Campylobacter sp. 2018MI10]MBT0883961.1 hypothetical protein [Campylobacter sp. 2018MI10]